VPKLKGDKLNVGVMGCADIAERYMLPAIKRLDECKLIAVASRNLEKAEIFSRKFSCEPIEGYDELLKREDVAAIYMPLPTGLHEEWIMKALEAGKHVLAEKAFAINFPSAQRIIEKARNKRLLVMENYMFLYHSQHQFVRELIDKGEIGEIRVVRSCFCFPPLPEDNFRYNSKLGGGALLDAGGYPVKAALFFLGNDLSVKGSFLKHSEEYDVDVSGGAIFKNKDDQLAEVAFGFENFYQCSYEILGSNGKITAERAFTPPPWFFPQDYFGKAQSQAGIYIACRQPFQKYFQCIQSFNSPEQI